MYLVLGMGQSGIAAAQFLRKKGLEVWATDDRPPSPQLLQTCRDLGIFLGPECPALERFQEVVVSPGVPPVHPLYAQALAKGVPVIGEAELALRERTGPCLGVTGTNGKTTVTLLTAHLLQEAGIPAKAVGNVGVPLTSQDPSEDSVWVVELSSFQLETMQAPCFDSGALLNVSPDHLDRYENFESYVQAKLRLLKLIKPRGLCWVERSFEPFLSGGEEGLKLLNESIDHILPVSYRERSEKEQLNLAAACALAQSQGASLQQCESGLRTFRRPEHRLEWVRDWRGLHFFNDSKGTNVEAVVHAVEGMQGETVVIAGGVDKGGSFRSWVPTFRSKVKAVCVIGEAANRIAQELEGEIPVLKWPSLKAALEGAVELAPSGGNVLLSPGCSSFDMFDNYAHRGCEFKRMVNALD